MKIIKEDSVAKFLEKNEESLLKFESEHNLLLGLSKGLLEKLRVGNNSLFYTIEDEKGPVGQAMRTDPDKPLILSRMSTEFILPLVENLKDEDVLLEGVIGPVELAEVFKDNWGRSSEVSMHQGIYQLEKVLHPSYEGGKLLLATEEDENLAIHLCKGFIKDCFPKRTDFDEMAVEAAKRHIKNSCLYFWKNEKGEVVSMAASTRESRHGSTLSWVYTEEKLRGQGFASRVVASLSQKLIDEGKLFCNLFTDLLNPTSNSIYKKVGYKMIASSIHYNFKA